MPVHSLNRFFLFLAGACLLAETQVLAAGVPLTLYLPGQIGDMDSVVWPDYTLGLTAQISNITPRYVTAGKGLPVLFQIHGNNFFTGAGLTWNSQSLPLQFLSATALSFTAPPADLATVGDFPVVVADPDGVPSNAGAVSVVAPAVINGFTNLTPFMPVSATLQVSVSGAVSLEWQILSLQTTGSAGGAGSAGQTGTPVYSQSTQSPALSLADANLPAGNYQIQLVATNLAGDASAPAQANVTLVANDLSAGRVYPNPWRSDKDAGVANITFDGITPGATVRIFTISARHVNTVTADASGTARWDMTNDSGERAASGVYLYVITDSQGERSRGKVSIIR